MASLDDNLRRIRAQALVSPYFFIKTLLKNPDMCESIHGVELEKCVRRMASGQRYKWVEWPRGFLKSSVFTQGLSVWLALPEDEADKSCAINEFGVTPEFWLERSKLRNQNVSQLLAFENLDNAKRKLRNIRRFFEDYQLFRDVFPEIAYSGGENPWNETALCIRRDPRKHIQPESTFEAIGVGGALQSRHFDVIWADDVVGKDAIKSETVMADTIQWFGQLNGVEQLGGRTWRFGVSNRWGFNDLNSYLRLNEPHWEFTHLKSYTLNEQGERAPTWPEMYPLEVLDQKRASMSDDEFFAQYQNEPRPPGGVDFDAEKFHRYKVLSGGEIRCLTCGKDYSVAGMNRYMHYDPYNAKGKLSRSLPAMAVTGVAPDKHAFLLDSFCKKVSYDEIFKRLFEMNTRWDPIQLTYEDVGAQNMAEFYIRKHQNSDEFRKTNYRKFNSIKPLPTGGKPMEIRVRDHFIPAVHTGKFGIHESHQHVVEMAGTFPHIVPGHDYDLLDCLAQGPRVWRAPLDSEEERRWNEQDERVLQGLGQSYSVWSTQ